MRDRDRADVSRTLGIPYARRALDRTSAMTTRHLVDRLLHLQGWAQMDAQQRLRAVLGVEMIDELELGEWELDDLTELAENDGWPEGDQATDDEVRSYAAAYFLTNPGDENGRYYREAELEELTPPELMQRLCETFEELTHESLYEPFDQWLLRNIASIKRSELCKIAGQGVQDCPSSEQTEI